MSLSLFCCLLKSTHYSEAQHRFSQNLHCISRFLSDSVSNYLFLYFSTSPLYLPVIFSTHTAGTVVGYFFLMQPHPDYKIYKNLPCQSLSICYPYVLLLINNCVALSENPDKMAHGVKWEERQRQSECREQLGSCLYHHGCSAVAGTKLCKSKGFWLNNTPNLL